MIGKKRKNTKKTNTYASIPSGEFDQVVDALLKVPPENIKKPKRKKKKSLKKDQGQ